jgi:hypothetical protein
MWLYHLLSTLKLSLIQSILTLYLFSISSRKTRVTKIFGLSNQVKIQIEALVFKLQTVYQK